MDEMSAALGLSQMQRIQSLLADRARVARAYSERLASVAGVSVPVAKPNVLPSWFVYVVKLADHVERQVVAERLRAEGIPTRGYFAPIHKQEYMRKWYAQKGTPVPFLPRTEEIAARTLALPFHGGLTEEDIDRVCVVLERAIS